MRQPFIIALFVVFAALLYANSIHGDYVLDDAFLVRDNPALESLSNFVGYFTSGDPGFGRPIRALSFYVDTALFGKNIEAYHISNILYYSFYCIAVYFFCQFMFHNPVLSIITALLFIAHPLHTEGVSYISGRKDLLGGLFSMAALICFIHYLEAKTIRAILLAVLFFLLAMASKEIYAVVPFLIAAIAVFKDVRLGQHKALISTLIAGAALFVIYVVFFRNQGLFDYRHTIPIYGNNQGVNAPTAIKICAYNIYLAFHPFSLSADYTFNAVKRIDLISAQFLLSLCTILGCAAGAWYFRRRNSCIAFGLLWILLCLLPVAQIVPYPEVISERSLILLSFGSCLIIAALIMHLPGKAGFIVLTAILLAFSATTVDRNRDWRDGYSLWRATVVQNPDCARARYNLGMAFSRQVKYPEAAEQFRASLALNPPAIITVPDYSLAALINLGNVYTFMGDYSQAKKQYQEVLRFDRNHKLARKNLKIVERMERKDGER